MDAFLRLPMYLATSHRGGILINLTRFIFEVGILFPAFNAHGGGYDLGVYCAEQIICGNSLVKVDYEHKRIFVAIKSAKQAELKAMIQKFESCFDNHEWSNQWSLSVFANKRIAGYKDEPNIIPFHKNNEWAKGYLAEYYSLTRTLTLAPATSPKYIIIPRTPLPK